jgi:hypothetical protein
LPNVDVNVENNELQGSSEDIPNPHNIASNDGDTMDLDSISPTPPSHQRSVTFQTPEHSRNISFLCNPFDEEPGLRQPSVSQLFGDNLSSVQKRSWAKDSTCEQVHHTQPV